jgi:hypothetical protein
MTCGAFENDLALYVARDLPSGRVPAVEEHLGHCESCPGFLDDLRASQSLVHGLAEESIGEHALFEVRARVITALAVSAPAARWRAGSSSTAVWAAAAMVVVTASILVWRARAAGQDPGPSIATTEPSRPQRPTVRESTKFTVAAVSPHMDRPRVSPRRIDRSQTVPALSADDADQLARAVVAVSQISSAHDRPPEPDPSAVSSATPLMRVATTDPNVAIYWQLDPSGGE